MKPKLRLEMRPANTQELQLICNCCGQPYYPDKAWEDQQRAIIFGAEKYVNCPLCTQAVPDDVFPDEGYRRRCRNEVARLQLLFESESNTRIHKVNSVAEPTYEELKARVAELEKQKSSGSLHFKVGVKGGVSVYGPTPSISISRLSDGSNMSATSTMRLKYICSGGCKWYHTLSGPASRDWGVCGNPRSHRAGLLTFEHQGCPEVERGDHEGGLGQE